MPLSHENMEKTGFWSSGYQGSAALVLNLPAHSTKPVRVQSVKPSTIPVRTLYFMYIIGLCGGEQDTHSSLLASQLATLLLVINSTTHREVNQMCSLTRNRLSHIFSDYGNSFTHRHRT